MFFVFIMIKLVYFARTDSAISTNTTPFRPIWIKFGSILNFPTARAFFIFHYWSSGRPSSEILIISTPMAPGPGLIVSRGSWTALLGVLEAD